MMHRRPDKQIGQVPSLTWREQRNVIEGLALKPTNNKRNTEYISGNLKDGCKNMKGSLLGDLHIWLKYKVKGKKRQEMRY